jgi:hypothetical protein
VNRSEIATLVAFATLALACVESPEPEPARDVAYFLDRLHQLDDLPGLELGTSELAATWDREGGNTFDGENYPGVDGDINVLLDVDGPGCIHRISTGLVNDEMINGHTLDATFELWLDGERLLELPASQLFDPEASPFAWPLVFDSAYPTVRMPIPFAEHAKVQLISPTQEWGLFWQIGYSRYPDDVRIETLELPLGEDAQRALDEAGDAWLDSIDGPPLPEYEPLVVAETLAPDAAMAWSDEGCGTIERFEIAVDPNWPETWRDLQVRITWDDAEQPAIELPAYRFLLGTDYGDDPIAQFDSLVLGTEDGRAYFRLPMPYREGAHIELTNTGTFEVEVELALWRERCSEQPEDFGYLHTAVNVAAAATEESPLSGPMQVPVHRLLDYQGRGKVVGTGLSLYWPYSTEWWGEGDWQIWADLDLDAWPPSYHGTGTEEFFYGGWTAFDRLPLSGAVRLHPGLVTVYGFMTNDAFNFEDHIRMQVETMGLFGGDEVIMQEHPEWATTVYWYDERPG